MDSNFRISAPPTFVNQRHQIPFPRVYVSMRLKFLMISMMGAMTEFEDIIEKRGDFVTGNISN